MTQVTAQETPPASPFSALITAYEPVTSISAVYRSRSASRGSYDADAKKDYPDELSWSRHLIRCTGSLTSSCVVDFMQGEKNPAKPKDIFAIQATGWSYGHQQAQVMALAGFGSVAPQAIAPDQFYRSRLAEESGISCPPFVAMLNAIIRCRDGDEMDASAPVDLRQLHDPGFIAQVNADWELLAGLEAGERDYRRTVPVYYGSSGPQGQRLEWRITTAPFSELPNHGRLPIRVRVRALIPGYPDDHFPWRNPRSVTYRFVTIPDGTQVVPVVETYQIQDYNLPVTVTTLERVTLNCPIDEADLVLDPQWQCILDPEQTLEGLVYGSFQ